MSNFKWVYSTRYGGGFAIVSSMEQLWHADVQKVGDVYIVTSNNHCCKFDGAMSFKRLKHAVAFIKLIHTDRRES